MKVLFSFYFITIGFILSPAIIRYSKRYENHSNAESYQDFRTKMEFVLGK